MKEYYPSLTEETLDKAILFASNHTTISLEDIRITKHSRKSLLFHLEQAWKKKSSSCFDVTMSSYDGGALCQLIGIFTLFLLGLYRDDELIVLNKLTSQKTEKIRTKVIQVFKDNGFSQRQLTSWQT